MTDFFYWFGVIHLAAYALAGFTLATSLFVNWIVARFKLKADLLRAAAILFKARRDKREGFFGA